MSEVIWPQVDEIRSGMRRMRVAMDEVERFQKVQIAHALYGATIPQRINTLQAVVCALSDLNNATILYLTLCGLEKDEEPPTVVEEAPNGR